MDKRVVNIDNLTDEQVNEHLRYLGSEVESILEILLNVRGMKMSPANFAATQRLNSKLSVLSSLLNERLDWMTYLNSQGGLR